MRFFDGDGYGADPSGNAAGGGVPGDPGGDNGASGDGATEPKSAIELPAGVMSTPAGAELAALLESAPVEQVSGFDTVEYMKAAHRLANHYQGMFLKALLETGLRLPTPDDQVARADSPGEFAGEEARAARVWSRSRADGALSRAYQMFGQTPAVGNALVDAAIDEPRANAFITWMHAACLRPRPIRITARTMRKAGSPSERIWIRSAAMTIASSMTAAGRYAARPEATRSPVQSCGRVRSDTSTSLARRR